MVHYRQCSTSYLIIYIMKSILCEWKGILLFNCLLSLHILFKLLNIFLLCLSKMVVRPLINFCINVGDKEFIRIISYAAFCFLLLQINSQEKQIKPL